MSLITHSKFQAQAQYSKNTIIDESPLTILKQTGARRGDLQYPILPKPYTEVKSLSSLFLIQLTNPYLQNPSHIKHPAELIKQQDFMRI